MKTENNTSPTAHAASETVVGLTTLDPRAGYITTMNIYTIAPERVEEVLEYLVRSAKETVRHVPGFVSMNFHVSLDGTQIVNYGQWKSRQAMAAAHENPKIVALMSETAKIAGSSKPVRYELRQSVAANLTVEVSMTTDNNTSPTAHAAPETGAGLTRLDPSAGYITIINTYAVAPERAEELLDFLVRATNETIRYVPRFVSANLHVNLDRTQLVNYAQWKSREAIAAARENPKVIALMREQLQIADSFTPIQYELRQSVAAAHE